MRTNVTFGMYRHDVNYIIQQYKLVQSCMHIRFCCFSMKVQNLINLVSMLSIPMNITFIQSNVHVYNSKPLQSHYILVHFNPISPFEIIEITFNTFKKSSSLCLEIHTYNHPFGPPQMYMHIRLCCFSMKVQIHKILPWNYIHKILP